MKKLAIIPARGGSKRIPRKNIKDFLGKPIIAYSIEAALASGLFDEVMVSTDDHEIAEVAVRYGAKVPFMRSQETSDDFATTFAVLEEVLANYTLLGENHDYTCCIYPTAPLVTPSSLKEPFWLMMNEGYDCVFPVVAFSYPLQRSLHFVENKIKMVWPENERKRSQDLSKFFHDAGQFYFFNTEVVLREKTLWTNNSGAVILSDLAVQDIDSDTDWKLAELKYQLMQSSK